MKLERTLDLGGDNFKIKYSYFGLEEYYLNGRLLEKKRNFQLSGLRKFDVNGKELVIDICMKPNNYSCKAFLDGVVHTEELFPEFRDRIMGANKRDRIIGANKKVSWKMKLAKNAVLWLVVFAVVFTYLQYNK